MGDGKQRVTGGRTLDGRALRCDLAWRRGGLAGGAGDPTGERRQRWRRRGQCRPHDGHRDGQGQGCGEDHDDPPAGTASPVALGQRGQRMDAELGAGGDGGTSLHPVAAGSATTTGESGERHRRYVPPRDIGRNFEWLRPGGWGQPGRAR